MAQHPQHRIHRFDFNSLRDFRGPIVMRSVEPEPQADLPPPPPAPVFSEADLEAARAEGKKQGFIEGFSAGHKEAENKADAKMQHAHDVMAQMADIGNALKARYEALLAEQSEQLSALVMAISQKIVGATLTATAGDAIRTILDQCLPVIFSKPKLSIELHPEHFEHTIGAIEQQLNVAGFEGEVQFKANESLGISDVTIDWGNGQVHRNVTHLWQEIESLLARMPLTLHAETSVPHESPLGE